MSKIGGSHKLKIHTLLMEHLKKLGVPHESIFVEKTKYTDLNVSFLVKIKITHAEDFKEWRNYLSKNFIVSDFEDLKTLKGCYEFSIEIIL